MNSLGTKEKIIDEYINKKLIKKNNEKRLHKRVEISENAMIKILNDPNFYANKLLSATILDISKGGVSILVEYSASDLTKDSKNLLGEKINIKFNFNTKNSIEHINKNGTIVGISYLLFNKYTLHVNFDKIIKNINA